MKQHLWAVAGTWAGLGLTFLVLVAGACTSPTSGPSLLGLEPTLASGPKPESPRQKEPGMNYQNPILTGMNPDPSIIRVGEDFYLVTSTFEYFPGLPIYHSQDLIHWRLIGHALDNVNNCPLGGAESAVGGNYAPTLRYDPSDKLFYVSCTNYGGSGSRGAFYVTAENPAGPWSDPVWVGNWYVDPSMDFDDGQFWWLSPNNKDGFLLGTLDKINEDWIIPLKRIADGLGGSSPEGPHLYHIGDWYYLISAEGGTGYDHREVVQRSKSPWGPYEASPHGPLLSNAKDRRNPFQAIGHADLVQLADGSWWAVCLGIRPVGGQYHHLGRETFLAPVSWTADGWPRVGSDGIVRTEFPRPPLADHPWPNPAVRDNFDSPVLGLDWNFIRNPQASDWSLADRPGYLRLQGPSRNFRQKTSQAFVGRRQTAFAQRAATVLDFQPGAANEEAGLVVRANDKNHYDLIVTRRDGQRVVVLRQVLKDLEEEIALSPLAEGPVGLEIRANAKEYRFSCRILGQAEAVELGTLPTKPLSTERVGGFTGVFWGMYATGNGQACTNPADFDWFDLETLD